jgi:hypothetical protein
LCSSVYSYARSQISPNLVAPLPRLNFELANYWKVAREPDMHENDLFPLETVPSRVKFAILREFEGRRPTVREVSRICDRSWLTVPGIGRTALASIRQATGDQQPLSVDRSAAGMPDAELLTRLEALQWELKSLSEALSAALSPDSKKRFRSRGIRRTLTNGYGHEGSGIVF